jgi:toxin ParE1/3/4
MLNEQKKYLLNPKASFDLENIWYYTFGNWGENQADKYYNDIILGILSILKKPVKLKSIKVKSAFYLLYPVKYHVIVHNWEDSKLRIVRILHEKMDFYRHLD